MNGKKAKELRQISRDRGHYLDHKTPKNELNATQQYEEIVVQKLSSITDIDGKVELIRIPRTTIINHHRIKYRQLKKEYTRGEIVIL